MGSSKINEIVVFVCLETKKNTTFFSINKKLGKLEKKNKILFNFPLNNKQNTRGLSKPNQSNQLTQLNQLISSHPDLIPRHHHPPRDNCKCSPCHKPSETHPDLPGYLAGWTTWIGGWTCISYRIHMGMVYLL